MKTLISLVAVFLWGFFSSLPARAAGFDFTKGEDSKGWHATHDVAPLENSAEGLVIRITGEDPYINGPAQDYPSGQPLWMTVKLQSEQDGMAQVFYFNRGPSEEHSIRFPVRGGRWEEIRIPMPALGPGYHLRFDPPGSSGTVVVAKLAFENRVALAAPSWPENPTTQPKADWLSIRAGELKLLHGPGLGEAAVRLGDRLLATSLSRGQIGYVNGSRQRWISLESAKTEVRPEGNGLMVEASVADEDGAQWTLTQRFAPEANGAIRVTASFAVNQQREVVFAPMLMLFPGAGTFQESKTQALFPGLEYLDGDEPSSSEADIVGPGSKRQVPDTLKITIPLMAIAANGSYFALSWQPDSRFAAVFDSPDRLFHSKAHVMGLIFPGSSGNDRIEGSLLPHGPVSVAANTAVTLSATLYAGAGSNCVEAVKKYVTTHPLPATPIGPGALENYVKLASSGWLESEAREGGRYRHAWPGEFGPQPAADAAWMMEWLASASTNLALAAKLKEASALALKEVAPAAYNRSGVSHVRYPVGSLLYGHAAENLGQARQSGRAMLKRFEPDGSLLYRPGKVDYGKTHFSREANGLTAQAVATLLEDAAACGDAELIREGTRLLRAMNKFTGTAPRGAQTWECPLHTPDILASAHLVKAYVLGHELTGDETLLETARYWAWTGVPFVYLVNPTEREVGPYATIAVYGATSWVAPNWMGLPVQWCGLVYADALYRLNQYDASGPWKKLADGIVGSGIQQSFPPNSPTRKGLLPDSYALRAGVRQNPAINPGTAQAPATRLFGRPAYDFAACRRAGLLIHAPGQIIDLNEDEKSARFKVTGTIRKEARALVAGCKAEPSVRRNGVETKVEWLPEFGAAAVPLNGDASVEITLK